MKAEWNGALVADSDETITVEGNEYFPPSSIKDSYFKKSDNHTKCHWKGEASYYHLDVDGKTNIDAAWYYPSPSDEAKHIKGYVAFWKGVEIKP